MGVVHFRINTTDIPLLCPTIPILLSREGTPIEMLIPSGPSVNKAYNPIVLALASKMEYNDVAARGSNSDACGVEVEGTLH